MPKKIKQTRLDPFKELAHGLTVAGEVEEQIWEEEPVDIAEFIESKHFLNQGWNGRTGCRPKILEIGVELQQEHIREAVLLLGKGGGKDYCASILHLYGVYRSLCMYNPQTYYGLAPGSPIYYVNTARNDEQAKRVFFAQFKGLLGNAPWFEGRYKEPGANSVNFDKGIMALSANSQAYSWLGYNTIQWVGDEIAFFLTKDDDEESESRAEECWEAAYGSCQTRFPHHYKMIGITTPRYDDDFVMRKFWELEGREDGYVKQAATWDIHPLLEKEDFKNALARDFRRAMRDFGAVPSGVIESFWADPNFVRDNPCQECRECEVWKGRELDNKPYGCVDNFDCRSNIYMCNGKWREELLRPDPEAEYCMHIDLSIKKDRLGFGLGHVFDWVNIEMDGFQLSEVAQKKKVEAKALEEDSRFEEKPLIKIDAIGWIAPLWNRDKDMMRNREIYYTAVLNNIIVFLVKRGYNIIKITFDQFQSHMLRQAINDLGIETDLLSLDRTDEVPAAGKVAFVENRVYYPYTWIMADEARNLKYIKGKKVDHIRGKSKDLMDVAFGTIWNCEHEAIGSGSFVGLEDM